MIFWNSYIHLKKNNPKKCVNKYHIYIYNLTLEPSHKDESWGAPGFTFCEKNEGDINMHVYMNEHKKDYISNMTYMLHAQKMFL